MFGTESLPSYNELRRAALRPRTHIKHPFYTAEHHQLVARTAASHPLDNPSVTCINRIIDMTISRCLCALLALLASTPVACFISVDRSASQQIRLIRPLHSQPTLSGQPWRITLNLKLVTAKGKSVDKVLTMSSQFLVNEGYEPPQGKLVAVNDSKVRREK